MPATREFSYGEILDEVRTLRWPSRGAVAAALAGRHSARRHGTSAEFTEYRPYRQGDPPQQIDWKVFARTDRAFIRLSHDHSVLPTALVVDASASMTFPAITGEKFRRASRLAVALASVAHNSGDPVGAFVVSGAGTRALTPRTRRGVIAEIARMLGSAEPGGVCALADAVIAASRVAQRVVVLSDMLGDLDDTLAAARGARAAGGELYAVHVLAREEVDPPAAALVEDPEDPRVRRTLTGSARAEYQRRFGAWRAAVAAAWRAAGVFYIESRTDAPLLTDVRQIIRARP